MYTFRCCGLGEGDRGSGGGRGGNILESKEFDRNKSVILYMYLFIQVIAFDIRIYFDASILHFSFSKRCISNYARTEDAEYIT